MKENGKALLLIILTCCILLIGCGQNPSSSETVPQEPVAEPGAAAVDFFLPEGFMLNPQPEDRYELVRDGQVVGGLAKSDLIKTDMVAYLETYVQPPLVMEYIYSSGKDNVWNEVDLIAYDPETDTAHEVSHYLFEKDGQMYDLFLDNELLEWETEKQILETSGLYLPEE